MPKRSRRRSAWTEVVLVNDYTPVAASVVALDERQGHLVRLGPPVPAPHGTRVVLGPGTGLGAGALVPIEDRLAIVATEAGHVEFGASDPDELALWPFMERLGGRVSAEMILSGPGLLRLARALAGRRAQACPFGRPNDVLDGASNGHPLGIEAAQLFSRSLGRFAGDLALTFEASGGVFIAGGIAPRMCEILREGWFREAFERKTPHEAWARQVPAFVIVHPEPALLGLSAIVEDPKRFVFQFQGWSAPA